MTNIYVVLITSNISYWIRSSISQCNVQWPVFVEVVGSRFSIRQFFCVCECWLYQHSMFFKLYQVVPWSKWNLNFKPRAHCNNGLYFCYYFKWEDEAWDDEGRIWHENARNLGKILPINWWGILRDFDKPMLSLFSANKLPWSWDRGTEITICLAYFVSEHNLTQTAAFLPADEQQYVHVANWKVKTKTIYE